MGITESVTKKVNEASTYVSKKLNFANDETTRVYEKIDDEHLTPERNNERGNYKQLPVIVFK
jgi:hypothetical protein